MLTGAGAVGVVLVVCAAARLARLEVTGNSMRPTLEPGDRLVVRRRGRVRPGDLVVVPDPREPARLIVKRAVAVSPAAVTLRGDNPSASTDSLAFGPVAPETVRGRVVYRYHPPHRRGRMGRLVP